MSFEKNRKVLEEIAVRFIINQPYFEEGATFSIFDLLIQFEQAYWHYSDFYFHKNKNIRSKSLKSIRNHQKDFIKDLIDVIPPLIPYRDQIIDELPKFSKFRASCPVAGIVIFNKDKSKVIAIRDTSQSKVMGFPKGKISEGESIAEAAIRETIEEIGIDVSPFFNPDQYKLFVKKKSYYFFYVVGVPEDIKMNAYQRNEISSIKWYDVSELRGQAEKSKITSMVIDWIEQISKSK